MTIPVPVLWFCLGWLLGGMVASGIWLVAQGRTVFVIVLGTAWTLIWLSNCWLRSAP